MKQTIDSLISHGWKYDFGNKTRRHYYLVEEETDIVHHRIYDVGTDSITQTYITRILNKS